MARSRARAGQRGRLARLAALGRLVVPISLALAIVGLAEVAAARPGGGESFSGGGGSGGSGGIGLIIDLIRLIYWILELLFTYPAIGLPILALVIGYFVYSAYRTKQNKDWDSGPPIEPQQTIALTDVQRLDPPFSQVVFEDFAFRLFSTAHRARHTADSLAAVAPYVSEEARTALASRAPVGQPVVQVVVGALRTYDVKVPDAAPGAQGQPRRVRIGLEYEANLATADRTYYTVERWLFGRDAAVQSKPPGAARTFPCPNCGAPWQASSTGTQVCRSCGEAVDNGRFDWVVEQISLSSSDERPPTLTTEVPERGTDLPTYRQPDIDAAWRELIRDDPELTSATLEARLTMIYTQLNLAWSSNELRPAHGLVSDGLYDYLSYWIDAYRRQGLRNVLADMRITYTVLARLTRDRYYDAITIRLWATGKDYVIRTETDALVRGSKNRERPYSEYWTLIRSRERRGPALAAPACGNCGAPLAITQSGECEHCGAHVTAGEFDWVLSRIEQDDTYRG